MDETNFDFNHHDFSNFKLKSHHLFVKEIISFVHSLTE